MEKKQNMSSVDELCVRYIFDELDPSEVTVVEQAMIEDQNLLIEVESLKSTWRRMKKMPFMQPPEVLSEAIIHQAKEHASRSSLFSRRWQYPGLMATAALVLLSLMLTAVYLLPQDNLFGLGTESEIATEPAPVSVQQAGNPGLKPPAPWIDRHNMLYIASRENRKKDNKADSSGSIRRSSMKTTDPVIIPPSQLDVQLTGTSY